MPASTLGMNPLAECFAVAAYFESASSTAFERLARELEAHGGPQRLIDACRRAQLPESACAMWLQHRLDPIEAVWVENAMRHAVTTLAHELDIEPSAELRTKAGVPSRHEAIEERRPISPARVR